MPDTPTILAIDQGTTSTRAILFDLHGEPLTVAQRPLPQIYPQDGWVEHDPEEIWSATVAVCRAALDHPAGRRAAAIGIANQRETTLVWERATGRPIHNAIVWQDRRGAEACRALVENGKDRLIAERTGLIADSYFSATKLAWFLDHVPGARAAALRSELAFGTIDSFLLWRLSGGRIHATDATNASRTMLFDIHRQAWDDELLALFDIPRAVLPEVYDCAADYGVTEPSLFGRAIPVSGIAGDQQAATIGQACFAEGMVKSTYGTGCFALANTGRRAIASNSRLLTTVAYRIGGETSYALEGSIFNAGSAVQWLRDGLKVIGTAAESERWAAGLAGNRGVYFVPAFTGLGAPWWDPHARGAIYGLARDTGIAEIVRATLEAVCYQTRDLLAAMAADGLGRPAVVRVDGGMTENAWLLQFLADIVAAPVERPRTVETTALGAAYLAGLGVGLYRSLDDVARHWHGERRFTPVMAEDERRALLAGWADAVARTRSGV